ncbi:MAG: hypothetical protein AAFN30_03515, partial [Actinomycetota bacterium]
MGVRMGSIGLGVLALLAAACAVPLPSGDDEATEATAAVTEGLAPSTTAPTPVADADETAADDGATPSPIDP